MHRIPALDGLRALAILAVMAYHLSLAPAQGGFLGVDLFFVLSGYLITSLLMGDANLGRFYKRRALRILPPLVLAVGLAVAICTVKPEAVVASLFFYANFLRWETLGALAHLWSLAIEEHFYLLWPVAFLFAGRWRIPLLWGVVVMALTLRIMLLGAGVGDEWIHKLTPLRADGLAIGCLIALRPQPWTVVGCRIAPFAMAAIGACFVFVKWPSFALLSFGFTAFAVLCGLMLAAIVAPGNSAVKKLLSLPAAQYVGRRSYGLYLFHWPIYAAVNASGLTVQWPIACVVAKLALTFAMAELSFRTVERAADRLRKHDEARPALSDPSIGPDQGGVLVVVDGPMMQTRTVGVDQPE
jgi:peptidoglycan/LPS O-acetylase OafA/YrhL